MALSNKAMLVVLQISQWTGRKIDQKATTTVEKAHKTGAGSGRYTKKLLPGSHELDEVTNAARQLRNYYYEQTLPWFSDGGRIISNKNYMKFTSEFRKFKGEFDQAVAKFISVYPDHRKHAQQQLGSLYDVKEYPSVSTLKERFKCEMDILPMPSVKDFRTQITEAEKKRFIKKMKEVEAEAMRDCWQRLHAVVSRAAEKLSDPKAIFRDTLVENIADICKLMPSLNISDDPKLEAARNEIEKTVSKLSPDVLRENKNERQDAAAKLAAISKSMGPFMGGGK